MLPLLAVLLLPLGAACAPGGGDPARDAAPAEVGRVEVRVLGPASMVGDAALCGGSAADTGSGVASRDPTAGSGVVPLPGVAAWVEGTPRTDGETTTVRWTACGPEPAAIVAAPGAALALENAGRFPLHLAWSDDGRAALAPGAVRRVEVPATALAVTAPGRDQAAWVLPGAVAAAGTDADGQAVLLDVPAGRARVHLAHPLAPDRVVEVEVPADGRAVVEVELRPERSLSAVRPGGGADR